MNIDFKAIDVDDVFEYLKWLLLAALVFAILFIGYKLGVNSNADTVAEQDKTIGIQRMAIQVQATRIREINTEAEKAIAAEQAAKKQAAQAGKIADRAEQKAVALEDDYNKRLRAARRNPGCEALLQVDVRKVCGL